DREEQRVVGRPAEVDVEAKIRRRSPDHPDLRPELLDVPPETAYVVRRPSERRDAGDFGLHDEADLGQVAVAPGAVRPPGPPVGPSGAHAIVHVNPRAMSDRDQAEGLQAAEPLTNRRPADAQRLHEIALRG